jgi:hypothetical protein
MSADVAFGADYIRVNMQGLPLTDESHYLLDLQGGVVPEPSTVLFLGTGLAFLAARFLRRRTCRESRAAPGNRWLSSPLLGHITHHLPEHPATGNQLELQWNEIVVPRAPPELALGVLPHNGGIVPSPGRARPACTQTSYT